MSAASMPRAVRAPDRTDPADPRPQPGLLDRRTRGLRLAVLAGLVLLTRLPGLVTQRAFNTDENTLGVGGRELARGGALYVDVIDRKPPLSFLAYSVFGTSDLRLVRLVAAVLVFVTALVVADEARRRWGERAAWVAGVALVLAVSALGPNDAQAANFEFFALLPSVVAVVAAARGRAALAGAALAVAVLCKQPAAVAIVPVAWSWWQTRRLRGVLAGLVAGGVATLVLTVPFGFGRVLDWALLGTGGYLGMDAADIGFALQRFGILVLLTLGFWGGAVALAAAWRPPVATAPHADADDGDGDGDGDDHEPVGDVGHPGLGDAVDRPARADLDLWLFLGASAVGVVAGYRFFPHYLVLVAPALALLAGRGAVRQPSWVRPALVWGVGASLVAGALSWQVVFTEPRRYEQALADYADAHSEPGDEILVWGNEPVIYWLADRQPAGGYTHSEFFTGYSGGRRARTSTEATVPDAELYRAWIDRLRADPPELVIDTAAAFLRGGTWFPISGYPSLTSLLDERYEQVAVVRGVPVYRLLPGGGSRSAPASP